ncbi:hypothetical protein [Capnocytophaga canimorsus]|uniref:hypothetical protein n=1 Tax=Capnocytophaga canimorsus TaxID=28188 RepID=UPI0037CCF0E3
MEAEKQVVDLLLKRGVQVQVTAPLFAFFRQKKTLILGVPTCETLLHIAGEFLKMEEIPNEITLNEAVKKVARDSRRLARIVALAVLNNPFSFRKTERLAKLLHKTLTQEQLSYLYSVIMTQSGVEYFISTIRYIGQTRITKPMLSQQEKTS